MNLDPLIRLALIPLLSSAGIAYLSTPLVIRFAKKIGIIDDPKKNKGVNQILTYPVPRGGGLAIFISIALAALLFLPLDKYLRGILIGALLLVILGLFDDKYSINPYIRLISEFIIALIPIGSGIGIAFLSNPIGGIIDLSQPQFTFTLFGISHSIWILSDIFALFWVVFLMNILNMGAKGVDGQLPGVTAIAALTIAALSFRYSADITQWSVLILASITAGAYLGFLPWHFYPQKIMPSYSGSILAGYFLGILSILSTTKVGTLMVVLSIPLVDTLYTIFRRILTGKSPVWGDRGHLHHKLLDSGLSKKEIAYFYWITTATLGLFALNLNSSYKLYTIGGIVLVIGGLLLWLKFYLKLIQKTQTSSQK